MKVKSLVKALIPRPLHEPLRTYRKRYRSRSWNFFCPICEERIQGFAPIPSFYHENLIRYGSPLRIEDFETCSAGSYSCPVCGGSDRDRLYALYLRQRLGTEASGSFRLLDVAPTRALSAYILRNYSIAYRTADLFMDGVDDRIDLTNMVCYGDNCFDAFICSHVLEHIPDDRKAMSELFRILKPGGWGITMVPIPTSDGEISEAARLSSEADRWKHFGQGDHVRLYSRSGFLDRLQKAGFSVHLLDVRDFGAFLFEQHGISVKSVLYVSEKDV